MRRSIFLLLTLLVGVPLGLAAKEVKVTVKTKVAQMKYDREVIEVEPGDQVEITLENVDDLPHNLVVCRPAAEGANDKGMAVAQMAWNLGELGMAKAWIPDTPRVMVHTKLVNPHESDTLRFTAPDEEVDLPFVCTFPGHALLMNGTISVARPLPPIRNLHYRYYLPAKGDRYKQLPDFSKLTPVEEGQMPAGKVDISMHLKEKKGSFAYVFEGTLEFPKDGEYEFAVGSDDGNELWIDGKKVSEHNSIHPFSVKKKKLKKQKKGDHHIELRYFEGGGQKQLYLGWSGPGFQNRPLSEGALDAGQLQSEEEKFAGMPLVVRDEARLYRNFIEGSSPRGIAVGFPGGVNLCWDADQMNVVMVWQGAFVDAKRHWTGRGAGNQPPLGYGVVRTGEAPQHGVARISGSDADWPAADPKDDWKSGDYRFQGYELGERRFPVFRYEYAGVKVEERFEVTGALKDGTLKLRRIVSLRGDGDAADLFFLAAAGKVTAVDGGWALGPAREVLLKVDGAVPVLRAKGNELRVPVKLTHGEAQISLSYEWPVVAK
ncbi:MAG: hypothetical protein H7A55_01270 [Verrucomicrobiaceae bacterium]|nr:hypothetical protein [Verrucomicrobiaceae bacterium]